MPTTDKHSLRGRLLKLLMAAIVVAAVGQAWIAYRAALFEADELFDYQMQQAGASLAAGLSGGGPISVPKAEESEDFDVVIQAWTVAGKPVFQSSARNTLPRQPGVGFSSLKVHDVSYRVYTLRSSSHIVQVAQDLDSRREVASELAARTVWPNVVMAPLLMLLVWWAVSASLAPIARVRCQVAARQMDDLAAVDEAGLPEEIRPLVHDMNLLLARLQQAFSVQRSFVADAAHELRSPLTALKLQVQGLQRAQDDDQRSTSIGRLNAGIDRATRLVEQLLVLARHESSVASGINREAIALCELARSGLADVAHAARAKRIDIGLHHCNQATILGDPEALRALLRNLIDNSLKYTPAGGTVDVAVVEIDGKNVSLVIEDSGPGIPEQERGRALDRFYRVVGTEIAGSGLGLAIVKSIADLHHATLTLDSSERLGGLRVEVRFPLHRQRGLSNGIDPVC